MQAALDGSAFAIVDAASRRTLQEQRADWIDTPVWPGSIAKIATYVGAIAAGTLTSDTHVTCTRRLRLQDGREVDCSHPEIGHPLSLTEALAHSCNLFAATMARAMPRTALARGFTRVGLPAPPADGDRVAIALGLAGEKVSPRKLLDMMRRVATGSTPELRLVREGLRESARAGTARAFGDAGLEALAKTGTAMMPNGHPLGLVIAAWPADAPREAVVLAMPGGSGTEAAALAALLAQRRSSPRATTNAPAAALPAAALSAAPSAASSDVASAASPGRIVLRIGTPTGAASTASATSETGATGATGAANGAAYRVDEVELEEYVASVVTGESSDATPDAVRDALAITARTYALANRQRHAADGFDLCRLTHCQVARPTASRDATRAAARTHGRVLRPASTTAPTQGSRQEREQEQAQRQGRGQGPEQVQVFYSAACGGQLADASAVLPTLSRGALPWMTERADPAGASEPTWSTEIRATDLLAALRRAGLRGDRLLSLVAQRGRAGARDVARIALDGLTPADLRADDFRRIIGQQLGWEKLKSLRFTVSRTASGYRFDGLGHGHGVGLCVFGASALAARGATTEQLLAAYFPGLTIVPIDSASARAPQSTPPTTIVRQTAIDLRLPSEQEGERDELRRLVSTHLDRLGRELGVVPPARIAIVVHPTGESYRRATGRAWWTSATMVEERTGVAVHLVPVPALRRNGRLQATLRHELVHVLTAAALRARPLWVQEGIAIHYAADPRERERMATAPDASAANGTTRAPNADAATAPNDATKSKDARNATSAGCPEDRAFRQMADRAVTERAYREAGACVARELARGGDWRQLGAR